MKTSIIRSLVLQILALSLGVQVGSAQLRTPTVPPVDQRSSVAQAGPRNLTIPQAFELVADASAQAQQSGNQPDPKQLEGLYHTVWETVRRSYYDEGNLKNWGTWEYKYKDRLQTTDQLNAALVDLLASLHDRWTSYRSPAMIEQNKQREEAGIVGLGVWMNERLNGNYEVVYVEAFSPAYHSPLRKGDIITSIDGEALKGLLPREVDRLLEGKIGTQKNVTFTHDGVTESVQITLFKEKTPPAEVRVLPGDILYMRLPEFQQASVDAFDAQIDEVIAKHNGIIKGLILDLRGNPGGLVELAKHIASTFIGNGDVILRMQERDGLLITEQQFRSLSVQPYMLGDTSQAKLRRADILQKLPMVVLIDGTSASSAEIVTAALIDSHRAVAIGETSWGKAVAWKEINLSNNGVLRYTSGKITAPAGYNWSHVGLKPQIEVFQPRVSRIDVQLIAATNEIHHMIDGNR